MGRDGVAGCGSVGTRATPSHRRLWADQKSTADPTSDPTQAKKQWAALGVNAHLVAEEPPGPDFPQDGDPTLSVTMTAILQGFPRTWPFQGRKTSVYRQVGNAFPPPVAEAVGRQIVAALEAAAAERSDQASLPVKQQPADPLAA